MLSRPRGRQGSAKTSERLITSLFSGQIDKQRQSRQKGKTGKLCCCFVDFRKAFDTVPRHLLWQVLEEFGIQGRILDIIESLYAHDSAAVRTMHGISAIFRCFLGVKQGCPLSPTLFGLYVDGLEKHLLETGGIDAPTLFSTLVPLGYMPMMSF